MGCEYGFTILHCMFLRSSQRKPMLLSSKLAWCPFLSFLEALWEGASPTPILFQIALGPFSSLSFPSNSQIPYLSLLSISEQDMADNDDASSSTGTSRSCWARAGNISLCSVFLAVIVPVIILGWRFIDKAPPPQGPDIRLLSLYVSNFSASHSQPRGTYRVGFKMSNSNEKMDMSLEEFRVSILHRGLELARTRVHELNPIPLGRTTEKDVRVSMAMKAAGPPKLPKKKAFAELEEERSRRVVNFHVRMHVTVGLGAADSASKSKLFNVNCGQLRVFFYGKRKDAGRLVGIGGRRHDCHVQTTE